MSTNGCGQNVILLPHARIISMVLLHIRMHLRPRLMEWMHALMLVLWGSVLARPEDTFSRSPVWVGLERIASEEVWAWVTIAIGLARMGALLVNGLWRPSYTIRTVTSFLSMFVWFTITLGLIYSRAASTGLAVYPVLFLFEAINLYYSALDGAFAKKEK